MNPTNSADAFKQMQDFGSSRKSLGDIYSGTQQELGVGEAQKRAGELKNLASSTENLIRGVDPSVTGRLQGGLATEAQRQRLVALETAPLTDMYRTQSTAYGDAQGDYRDLYGRANEMASTRYQADNDRYNTLKDLYSTLSSQEQAAEEKRRWEQQQAETMRQFNETLADNRRQFEAQLAQIRATTPTLADIMAGVNSGGGNESAPSSNKSTPIYGDTGQIYGYDTPTQSFLTAAGQKAEDAFWKKQNSGYSLSNLGRNLGKAAGNVGKTLTGIFGGRW